MPNWVYNNLVIVANDPVSDGADLERLVEQVGAEYCMKQSTYRDGKHEVSPVPVSQPFSFWNIVRPEDEDLVKYEDSLGTPGAMPFWYDWNCENWGTKWDAGNPSRHLHPHGVAYTFDTAWSPPLQAMAHLSQQHPNLILTLEWEEEQGFGGTFEFKNGEVEETDSYDAPMSHADYVARDRTCFCEGMNEKAFDDCPIATRMDTGSEEFPADELEIEVMT